MNDDQAIIPYSYRGVECDAIRIGDRVIYDRHTQTAHIEVIFVAAGAGIGSEMIRGDATAWGASDADLYTIAIAHFELTAA